MNREKPRMVSIRCKYSIQFVYYLHNNYQHRLLYATKSTTQSPKSPNLPFTNYLINHLGFSHQQALSTSTKLRSKNTYFKFCDNANSVVTLFKQHGFDNTHIKKIVSSYPRILAANADQTLKPKFKILQDQGFSGSNLIRLIISCPSFLVRHMNCIIQNLRTVLGSDENLIKVIIKCKYLTSPSLNNLVSNIALLNNEYGVDIQVIRSSIVLQPPHFLRNTQFFRNLLVRVEEELGIPPTSGMFLYGLYLLSGCPKKSIESKCQLFKSFGWTEFHVSELMRRNPVSFLLSEKNIRKKLGFLMTGLGYKPDFLARHHSFFTYSIEKRMAPRRLVLLVLKDKGLLDYNFYTATLKTEPQFVRMLIDPYKEDVPGLLELYQKSKGCSDVDAISR